MKCIAIDDEPKALAVIRHYAEKVPFLELEKEFRSSLDALEFLNKEAVDLILLDINMPDLTGIEFLQTLTSTPLIIFTTAYAEYAVQSYEWETVGYLLKPIAFSKFLKAVNKAALQHQLKSQSTPSDMESNHQDFLWVKSGTQTHQLRLEDIIYIEASGNHVYFVTQDKKIIAPMSLQEAAEKMPDEWFYRIHKSFIIAAKHLEMIERHQVKVKGITLPIGKTYRNTFHQQFKKIKW